MSNCKVIALTSSRQAMLYRHAEASACLSRTAVSPLKITTAMLGCDFVFDADAQANLTMSLGITVINALAAVDSVIIPTQPHYLSAKGLELLLGSVSKVRRQINPKLKIDGILMTMVQTRTNLAKEVIETVREAYGQRVRVFDAQIPYSVRAAEASAAGMSIYAYDKGGKVAEAYGRFTEEVMSLGERQYKNQADRLR